MPATSRWNKLITWIVTPAVIGGVLAFVATQTMDYVKTQKAGENTMRADELKDLRALAQELAKDPPVTSNDAQQQASRVGGLVRVFTTEDAIAKGQDLMQDLLILRDGLRKAEADTLRANRAAEEASKRGDLTAAREAARQRDAARAAAEQASNAAKEALDRAMVPIRNIR